MGTRGATIMGFFGAVFASMTLTFYLNWSGVKVALPFLAAVVILLAGLWIRWQPGSGMIPNAKVRRVILWSTVLEVIGLIAAIFTAVNLHRPALITPAITLVVGLHFVPIAIASRSPIIYALSATLLTASVLGFVIDAPTGGEVSGFAATIILWLGAVLALYLEIQAKRATSQAEAA